MTRQQLTFDYDDSSDQYIISVDGKEFMRTNDDRIATGIVMDYRRHQGQVGTFSVFQAIEPDGVKDTQWLRELGARASDVPRT